MAAAHDQITEHGPDVGMGAIAAAAGVAVGTLYRNFPTKADLVHAVVTEHAEAMVIDVEQTVTRVLAGAPVLAEIRGVMSRFVETSAESHAVKAAAGALGAADYGPLEKRAWVAVDKLVTAGKGAGVLRPDAKTEDLMLLITTAPSDVPREARTRWLSLFLDGLTTGTKSTKD